MSVVFYDFESSVPDIKEQIERTGFCILKAPDVSEEVLIDLALKFGRILSHDRSKINGVVDVTSNPKLQAQKTQKVYRGLGVNSFEPHTDGAFLNYLYSDELGNIRHLSAPSLLLLQCVQQAKVGGESILVDGQSVYERIRNENSELLQLLSQRIFRFVRLGQKHTPVEHSIFSVMSNGNVGIRFRNQYCLNVQSIINKDKIFQDLSKFFFDFVCARQSNLQLLLEPGDVLIIDNFRMLHGRSQFSVIDNHHRHLRRLWVVDEGHLQRLNASHELNVKISTINDVQSILEKIKPCTDPAIRPYSILGGKVKNREFILPNLGIKI